MRDTETLLHPAMEAYYPLDELDDAAVAHLRGLAESTLRQAQATALRPAVTTRLVFICPRELCGWAVRDSGRMQRCPRCRYALDPNMAVHVPLEVTSE